MSSTPLEDQLTRALQADAERAPHPVLTLTEFLQTTTGARPTRRRAGTGVRWTALAAVMVLSVGIVTVSLSGRHTGSAFASWVSRPSPISAADATAVQHKCADQLETSPGPVVVGGGPHPASLGSAVLIDRRGSTAYTIFSDGVSWIDCITSIPGRTPDAGLPNGYLNYGTPKHVALSRPDANNPMVVLSVKAPEGNSVLGHPIIWVSGRISEAVDRIEIQTTNGTVIPTIANAMFAAWWPGNDSATAVIRAYDGRGRLVSTIDQLNCSVRATVDPRIQVPGQPTTGGCQ